MKWLLALLLLTACSARLPPSQGSPADSASWYRQAAAAGTGVYAVDAHSSLVTIIVRRAGLLARLGHDHVIASRDASGFAAPSAGRADLSFRVGQLTVDEPALRHEAGITSAPSQQAIEGTRTNMLTRVLEAERFPQVLVHVDRASGGKLRAAITIHGVTRSSEFPATVQIGPDVVSASGALRLRQSDFGMTPFAIGAGLLAVDDEIELRFRIVARRWYVAGRQP